MLDFIVNNLDALLAVLAAVIALGTAIAVMTPTQKDDTFWAKVKSWFTKVEPVVKTYGKNKKDAEKK